MKLKYKKITQIVAGLSFVVAFMFALVLAPSDVNAVECSILPDSICNAANSDSGNQKTEDTAVWKLLILVVNILTAGVAILAIGGLIYGAVLYTSAGDNQGQLGKAKDTIRNTVIGIVAFALMYSLLQWLIPGGVFN